jgi:hypothetical protein
MGVLVVKPHQHRDFLGHHHDHGKWGGKTTLSIVLVVEFGWPPWVVDLKNFLDTLVFWKTIHYSCLSR